MPYLPNNSILIGWFILFLCLKPPAQAQDHSFVEFKGKSEYTLTSGKEQQIPLSFHIKKGYHIQADQVKSENLIPSVLSFETSDGLSLGNPVFPKAVEFWMKGVEEPLDVFGGVLEIRVPIRAERPMEKETLLLKGNLHYQACDASKCYFPRDLRFTIKILIHPTDPH